MNQTFALVVEAISPADMVALRQLARLLADARHDLAVTWTRQLVQLQPEALAGGAVSTEHLTQLNEAFLNLVLSRIEQEDLPGLFEVYYESTRRFLEADLVRAPSRPISLVGMHASACVCLDVIREHLGPGTETLMMAYMKLSLQLLMLVGQAYTDTREAYLQRTFEQINTLSHELRTPLARLFSYLELLHAGEFGTVSPKQEHVLSDLIHEADELLLLLTNTLDLSRLDTGRVAVRSEEIHLAALLDELLNTTPHEGIAVTRAIAPDVPVLHTDRIKLKQIIGNLLRNALHHGNGSPVSITAQVIHPGHVELSVRDQGPGIAPENRQVIFEFFERGNAAGLARDGYGIGLHVVRRLVDLLGGTICVESTAGKGACFRVTLPLRI